jgi:hypothetical protein
MSEHVVLKTEIEWRSDIEAVPQNERILMIATSLAHNVIPEGPDIVVAHWHIQDERWVAGDVCGEDHRGQRPALKPIYWAELPALPHATILRPADFKG